MRDIELDSLVASGDIVGYAFEQCRDANRYNDVFQYEKITLVFPSGRKLVVSPMVNGDLLIHSE